MNNYYYSRSAHNCANLVATYSKNINKNVTIDDYNCKIANLDRVNELISLKTNNSISVIETFEKNKIKMETFLLIRK
jgi:hypothetical protein